MPAPQSAPSAASFMRRLTVLPSDTFPAYVVWELTLRCDQPCAHCGSRAGAARARELSTAAALDVVDQLKAAGAREVVLIGGEAYLHAGFLAIIQALKAAGIRPTMTTGGRGITPALAAQMKDAGIYAVSVSVDGPRTEHDLIRKANGSFDSAMAALRALRAAGIRVAANTNINRLNAPTLEELFELLCEEHITAWQVQLTVPLGRAADRPQMILQPFDLLDVVPRVAALKQRALARGITLMPGNNLGYFGDSEALLRSPHAGGTDHWRGCQAGKLVMGIESDGGVKGCPSLQQSYVGGNLTTQTLEAIWTTSAELAFNRVRDGEDPATARLWGRCAACAFASVCKGGCTFTAHALFGRPGNNPYCHHRARMLAAEGKRERLVAAAPAPGKPFDHGLFELVEEARDAPDPHAAVAGAELVQITRPASRA